MARYGAEHAADTRKAIVAAASRMLREKGLEGPSVVEIMKSVGLTHGGFYAHFTDRTALVDAAVEEALSHSPDNFRFLLQMAASRGTPEAVAAGYLSDGRLSNLAEGCPAAAFAGELHRAPDPIRKTFSAGAEATSAVLGEVMPGKEPAEDRGWGALALLIGALVLMRATPDPAMRERIRSRAIRDFGQLARAEPSA
jgi:TetR/AcrR family transcriptional regulator, transcriptional repressor for nem operon